MLGKRKLNPQCIMYDMQITQKKKKKKKKKKEERRRSRRYKINAHVQTSDLK